jgi:hypothetical protein
MEPENAKPLIARVAARQAGRIADYQLAHLGVTRGRARSWALRGYLLAVAPGVFAVGHLAPSLLAELWTAVLYAGPGAMLSHATAAWWLGLIERLDGPIHISTPRRTKPQPGLVIHGRRHCIRAVHLGLPVTTIVQALLDLAASCEPLLVRRALAQLDYRGALDPRQIAAACRPGVAGSVTLGRALRSHMPELARANGRLELDFLLFCERYGIPLPLVNVTLHGLRVDAYWPAARLVVELDGRANHSSPAQLRRDRARELTLRRHGLRVLRYGWEQIHHQPEAVRDDLLAALAAA